MIKFDYFNLFGLEIEKQRILTKNEPIQMEAKFTLSRKYLITLITFILVLNQLNAQIIDDFSDDMNNSWKITKELGSAISGPSAKDQRLYLLGGAAVLSSFFLDKSVRRGVQKNKTPERDAIFNIDRYYGTIEYTAGSILMLYGAGLLADNRKIRKAGLHVMQAYLYTGIFTVVVKDIVGRARPNMNEGPLSFSPFRFKERNRAFFSGHASTTFAISTVIAHEVDHLLWKALWYGAAGLVAGARIYQDKHWLSDVLAGALVGYAIGNFVSRQNYDLRVNQGPLGSAAAHVSPLFSISIPLH